MKNGDEFLRQHQAKLRRGQQQAGQKGQQQDPGGGHQRFKGMFRHGVNRQLKRH